MSNTLKNTFIGNKRIQDIASNTLCLALKKIKGEYTGSCLRLRRSSDSAESDFGFDTNGNVDTSSISTWGGASTLYIVKWYDQSGYANNALQPTPPNQPRWDNTNKKIVFDGTTATGLYVVDSNTTDVQGGDFSLLLQSSLDGYVNYGSSVNCPLVKSSSTYSATSYGFILDSSNNIYFKTGASAGSSTTSVSSIVNNKTNILGIHKEGIGSQLYFNQTQKVTGSNANPISDNALNMLIGYDGTIRYADMDCYSILLFKKALSSAEISLITNKL
jgi:hypothetical protein